MKDKRMSARRMDWKMKVIEEIDKGDHTSFRVELIPHPDRYELKTIDGKQGYWDKFDKLFMPLDVFKDFVPQMESLPIFYSPPEIKNIENYTRNRIEEMKNYFEKEAESYAFKDKSEEFLESLSKDKMQFVILSIDLKGSTKMSQQLSIEDTSKIIALFSKEISQLVYYFNGYILKYLGDGIIAYFPEPNFIGMNDNAIDCATSTKYFILNGLNKVLDENNLPLLNFRIGLDSGEAMVVSIGSKLSKMHKDLIGQAINLATKIQSLAGTNQILAGEITIQNAHYTWRKLFERIELPENWNYLKYGTTDKYQVYAFKY